MAERNYYVKLIDCRLIITIWTVGRDVLALSVSGKGEGTSESSRESTEHVLPIVLDVLEDQQRKPSFIFKLITRSWFGRSIANSQRSLTLSSR